jgi:hypothetical protein
MEMVSKALEEVEQLAQLMAQHGATRIEISDDGQRIALTRVSGAGAPPMHEESLPPLFVSGYAEPAHARRNRAGKPVAAACAGRGALGVRRLLHARSA